MLRDRWSDPDMFLAVCRAVQSRTFRDPAQLSHAIYEVLRFFVWCESKGFGHGAESCFRPEVAESYLAELGPKGRSSARHHVAGSAGAMGYELELRLPGQTQGPRWTEPYSQAEIDAYWKAAQTQSTLLRRRTGTSLLGLCHGAGLGGHEVGWVTPADIQISPGLVAVRVGAPRARIVPIQSQYHEAIRDLLDLCPDGDYLCGRNPAVYKATHMAWQFDGARSQRSALPVLRTRRLRATWLLEMVQRPIPLAHIVAASGVTHSRLIQEISGALPTPCPTDYAPIFQGTTP